MHLNDLDIQVGAAHRSQEERGLQVCENQSFDFKFPQNIDIILCFADVF